MYGTKDDMHTIDLNQTYGLLHESLEFYVTLLTVEETYYVLVLSLKQKIIFLNTLTIVVN